MLIKRLQLRLKILFKNLDWAGIAAEQTKPPFLRIEESNGNSRVVLNDGDGAANAAVDSRIAASAHGVHEILDERQVDVRRRRMRLVPNSDFSAASAGDGPSRAPRGISPLTNVTSTFATCSWPNSR